MTFQCEVGTIHSLIYYDVLFTVFFFIFFLVFIRSNCVILLGNDVIERWEIKMKNMKEWITLTIKFGQNIYCNSQTLEIINSVSLQILKFKGKVNFGLKLCFSYFFSHWFERYERKLAESGARERIFVGSNYNLKNSWYLCQIIIFDERSSN